MRFVISIIAIFSIGIPFHAIFPQNYPHQGKYFIQFYNHNDYNTPENQIWAIEEDQKGKMYFGNNDGILEFDGNAWNIYETPNKSTIRALLYDEKTNRIYVGAVGELGFLEPDSIGTLQYNSLMDKLPEEHRYFEDVWQIAILNNDIIFRTTHILFVFKKNTIQTFTPKDRFHTGFLVNNKFYIREWGKGLFILENDSLNFINQSEIFADERIYVMLPYEQDHILLICRNKGIYMYSPNPQDGNAFRKDKRFQEIDQWITKNQVYCGVKSRNGHFIAGTLQDGFIIFDKNGKIIRHINKKTGLQDDDVLSIFIDSKDNIWAGLNEGIAFINVNSQFSIFNENMGLEGTVLTAEVYDNTIFAGTSLGMFYKTPDKDFSIIDNTLGQSWAITKIQNELLLGHTDGLFRIKNYNAENIILNIGTVWNIHEWPDSPYLLAGLSNGLIFLEKINNTWKLKHKVVGFNESSRYLQIENEKSVWISHENKGIYWITLNPDLETAKNIHFLDDSNGLPSNTNNYVHKIQIHNKPPEIVFGTENGIYKFDKQTRTFLPDKRFDILHNGKGHISRFVQDPMGNIIFQQEKAKGILHLQEDGSFKLQVSPFSKFKDLFFEDITIIDSTRILFCSREGIIQYNPDIITSKQMVFPAIIRKISANDSIIYSGQNNPENILQLPFKYNNLYFSYSALYFEDHEKTEFSYFLEGFSNTWSEWSLKTYKEYTNLPEGNYIFKIKAKNVYNKESTIDQVEFEILAPWYRTVWAYLGYIFTLFLIIYAGIKINTRRLKQANIYLEKIVKDRTAEITAQKNNIEEKNSMLAQQNEEIESQAQHLSEVNKELEKLSIVASETNNVVIIMDEKGNMEWANNAFNEFYNCSLEEFIQEHGKNLKSTSSNTKIKENINQCIQNKKAITYENSRETKTGTQWFQTTLTPILDSENQIIKLVAIDSNINELKKAEFEITKQRDEITDSIFYAKRIQTALMPSAASIDELLPEYFILDLPKSIVSGDFYWISKIKDKIIMAVADCTGHGVPGAFMSMLGISFLNKIVNEKKVVKPDEILNRLRKNILRSLHQRGEFGETSDGMDISVISYNPDDHKLDFAGAMNPIYLVRDGELIEYYGNTMPVGIYELQNRNYSSQTISIRKNDFIYMFTDGYADQFGGERNQKFRYKKFKNLLLEASKIPVKDQRKHLENALFKWMGKNEQVDDILILGFRV